MLNRKEAIKQYKQTVQPMGIFQIRNLSDGNVYIDSSKNLNGSKNSNLFQLKMGTHMNRPLQDDYTRLGADRFVFEILDQLKPKEDLASDYTEDLAVLKTMWLEKLQPYDEKGYNVPAKSTV